MSEIKPRVCVVGCNLMDMISYVPRLPTIVETLHGSKFTTGFGGKGANQAVMAAKLGADVTMVTKLGTDSFGQDAMKNFQKCGISTKHVLITDKASTGVAQIAVDQKGSNSIIIVVGANELLNVAEIQNSRPEIMSSQILICQLELPLEISVEALKIAREEGVTTCFNPAPARAELPAECYTLSDFFCPNEPETELLTGMKVSTIEEAKAAALVLLKRGPRHVILTLGSRGSLLVTDKETTVVPVEPTTPVDTTGAGDSWIGSFAFFLAKGLEITEAMRRANMIARVSVQTAGTQTSFPSASDLPQELFL